MDYFTNSYDGPQEEILPDGSKAYAYGYNYDSDSSDTLNVDIVCAIES